MISGSGDRGTLASLRRSGRQSGPAASWASLLLGIALVGFATGAAAGVAQVSTFVPSQDNNIYAAERSPLLDPPPPTPCTLEAPTLCLSNGAGDAMAVSNSVPGSSLSEIDRRGLVQFDLSTPESGNAIAPGSTITSVTLTMFVTNVLGGGPIALKPLAESWGEGTSDYAVIGQGGPGVSENATQNDATWVHRFYNAASPASSTPWTFVGGTCRPFVACSAAAPIGATTIQVFGVFATWSGAGLTGSVQSWADEPPSNFGWIIEALGGPVSLATREALPANRPLLTVNFVPEPASGVAALAALATLAQLARSKRRR